MGFQPLPRLNGHRHLPIAKGKYVVGTTDITTTGNLQMRCFYPTKLSTSSNDYLEGSNSWPHWLPSLEYADGYTRFKLSTGLPLVGRLFRFLISNPLCPTQHNSQVLNTGKPQPVVVFSHGMGAMRTTYSILLSELASNGNFVAAVEHKDGSGSATSNVDGTWTYEKKIQPNEDEYEIRNSQVNQRVKECELAYQLLHQLVSVDDSNPNVFQLHDPLPQEFLDSLRQAKLNLTEECYVSGHSFGGATALKSFYTSMNGNGQKMFKKALLFDSWLYPIRQEAEKLAQMDHADVGDNNVYFVNCQRFQGMKNIATMRHFEKEGNILTLKDTMHYAPCDIPTVMMGSWMRLPFTLLFGNNTDEAEGHGLPASKALDVCSQIAVSYFTAGNHLTPYLDSINDDYVIHGTSYMDST